MQPFGVLKNAKATVQTRKQPPVHRYPVPFAVVNQGASNPEPPGQSKGVNPFAEDKASDDAAQHFNQQIGIESTIGYGGDKHGSPPRLSEPEGIDFFTSKRGKDLLRRISSQK